MGKSNDEVTDSCDDEDNNFPLFEAGTVLKETECKRILNATARKKNQ